MKKLIPGNEVSKLSRLGWLTVWFPVLEHPLRHKVLDSRIDGQNRLKRRTGMVSAVSSWVLERGIKTRAAHPNSPIGFPFAD